MPPSRTHSFRRGAGHTADRGSHRRPRCAGLGAGSCSQGGRLIGEGEACRVHTPPAGKGRKAKFVAEVSRSEERIKELVHVRAECSSAVEKEGRKEANTESLRLMIPMLQGRRATQQTTGHGALRGMRAVFPALSYSRHEHTGKHHWLTRESSPY